MALRPQTDALGASLDLLVLETVSLTPMHGWGIGCRSAGGTTDDNHGARSRRLTAARRRALGDELENWRRCAAGLEAMLRGT